MKKQFKKHWIILAVIIVAVAAAAGILVYRSSLTRMLDQSEYKSLTNEIREAAEADQFSSQDALRDYISEWADSNELKYRIDSAGNIIFARSASERKKKLTPTIVCVSYNYETAAENSGLLAGAAMIAKADITSGRRTVIFFNDEQNNGTGYRSVSAKYFKNKPKVIYMDYGNSSYVSNSSFCKNYSSISVKAGRVKPTCDTAVRVHISGIPSGQIGTGIDNHPDPVAALGTLLARLKSRSVTFQLADFEIGTNGSMYPVSMDAVIMLNSYAVPSFTKYIDSRIKAWEKAYRKDYEDLEYTYEVIDDSDLLPEKAYTRKSTATLANVLYTIQTGVYKYEATDVMPEGREAGDVCGINAFIGMHTDDGHILVDLMTQAYDDTYMDRIMGDNTAAAELFGCTINETSSISRFLNERDSLQRTIESTYSKLSKMSAGDRLTSDIDNFFTPCSYLAKKNSHADIIHMRLNSDNAAAVINTIICYIAYKGNNFLL